MLRLDRIALGQALAGGRARWRLTVREAAELTGVSSATISRAERASEDAYQSAQSVLVLCAVYGLDPLAFLVECGGEVAVGDMIHVQPPMKQTLAGG
ncbi:helix-turn-helix domain-containing protein [Pannonibacter sp. SL95]|uniref:helix-turn-helix domain-containing protein n=1 Tax=Pannonibacter sp. SL95 TaxID=2995153 RepID=UPI0022761E40|nr:helix-turn-helix transcriptional regulator [Pannonibacter sp. SL95]MCY1704503.1 helix-turn-helix transcriptional regulator [Pannonibacter sp. SL95]MCY1707310.1 helix-turn-helix transcriptional regulator [Pannonibacter sp. SL95]